MTVTPEWFVGKHGTSVIDVPITGDDAHLERADLAFARLDWAILSGAHLDAAQLFRVCFK